MDSRRGDAGRRVEVEKEILLVMTITKPDGTTIEIDVDDNSYRYRAIRNKNELMLYFSSAEFVDIPVGSTCVFKGETYALEKPDSLTMHHRRNYEYTVLMEGQQAKAAKWKFREMSGGDTLRSRIKFPLTATPREHLQMFVDNMNKRDTDGGWAIGNCINGVPTTINYDHDFCLDALNRIADTFSTEFEITGKTVSLWKVEYNKNNPLPLSYGRGNGFLPDIGRSNFENSVPIEVLFVQGGDRNIDPSTNHGSRELLLPFNRNISFDGTYFEGEDGYRADLAHFYISSGDGLSIRRGDKELSSYAEDSLDCSGIYPSRVGAVSAVEITGANNNLYDIIDVDNTVDYSQCGIAGEVATIIFQSGMLAGKEFEIQTNQNGDLIGYTHADKRFKLVQQEIEGLVMPGGAFVPQVGDKYAVFNIRMPSEYIDDDDNKSGASWDMMREAVRYLFDNEVPRFTFRGELDGIWAKRNWHIVGEKITLGGYIAFSDDKIVPGGRALIRITGIREYVNKPYSPQIEISNTPIRGTVSSRIKELEAQSVAIDEAYKQGVQFTKRRYRDAKEQIGMLTNANLDGFGNPINPLAITSMMALFGSDQLQFQFVADTAAPMRVDDGIVWDNDAKMLRVPQSIIQHMTLGVVNISSRHEPGEYKFWSLPALDSEVLVDPAIKWYLYASVDANIVNGETGAGYFVLGQTMPPFSDGGRYNMLVGLLGSELDGIRSFTRMYGYSAIYPGQVIADALYSSDGTEMVDFLKNIFKISDSDYRHGMDYGITRNNSLTIKGVNAGMSGHAGGANGEDLHDDVRFYAGSDYTNRATAPYRVTHDGEVYASKGIFDENVQIRGSVTRPFVRAYAGSALETGKHDNVYFQDVNGDYNLIWDETQNGREVTIVHDGGGFAKISTPNEETAPYCFYENGVKLPFITLSRQFVVLKGAGGERNKFAGWLVQYRGDFATREKYGREVKVLCFGRVNADGTFADYSCFDDYWDVDSSEENKKTHRSILTCTKLTDYAGHYRISFPSTWNIANNGTNYIVLANSGFSTSDSPTFVSVVKRGATSFELLTADDSTANDAPFDFQMISLDQWL